MTLRRLLRSLAILALAAGSGIPSAPALAQMGGPLNPGRPQVGTAPPAARREAPPPALPGARSEPSTAAPVDPSAVDLPPTEALFDAINRGDVPAARDAISRGADLSQRNVLGLTPLELAVDLGQNEITFALLSMRGGEPSGPPRGSDQQQALPARLTAAERRAREREEREQRRQQAQAARAAGRTVTAQAAGPRLFARDGGAPVPQVGFLGFDPAR